MRASFLCNKLFNLLLPYPSCLSFLTPPSFGHLPYMANATQRRSVTHFILLLQFGELLCNKLFNCLPYNCIVKHPVRLRDTAGRRFKSLLSRYWALPDNDIRSCFKFIPRQIETYVEADWSPRYAVNSGLLTKIKGF